MTSPLRHTQRTGPDPGPEEFPLARWLAPVKAPDGGSPAPEEVKSPGLEGLDSQALEEFDTGAPEEVDSSAPDPEKTRPAARQQGPLVAVCGLCGGAGASTLAYLIARFVALDTPDDGRPVLALDAGGTTGGLSLYSRVASPRSLAELTDDIRTGRGTSAPMFTTTADGVRVIAATPRVQPQPDLGMVSRILSDARQVHRMTVVDCGTLSLATERLALELATHVVWIVPATKHGLRRAGISPWNGLSPDAVQVLVARRDPSARRASTRALAAFADARDSTLVLMPHVEDVDTDSLDRALEVCGVTLEALATKLRQ